MRKPELLGEGLRNENLHCLMGYRKRNAPVILCMRCNRALGLLRDDPIVIEQLLSYIRSYK